MFKTHTHILTHTHLCISIKLSLLCLVFPFFSLSLHQFIRVSVHVWQCALPTCVFNYVQYVCIAILFVRERLRVCVCVFEGN